MSTPEEITKTPGEIMKTLFDQNVKDVSKKFNSSSCIESNGNTRVFVWGCWTTGTSTLLTYDDDGVKMKYYKRFDTYLGDSDTFIDKYVECDGKILLESHYGYE